MVYKDSDKGSLIARFAFKKPVVLEEREQGQEVVTARCKTVIRTDAKSMTRDLPLLLSMAKLAETDPLLVTFYFSKGMVEEEQNYAHRFFNLCSPLRGAWVWKTFRKFAKDIYDCKFDEMVRVYRSLKGREREVSDPEMRRDLLGLFAIVSEGGVLDSPPSESVCGKTWAAYVRAIIEYARREPETTWYCNLPPVMREPYVVRIQEDACGRLYSIKKL